MKNGEEALRYHRRADQLRSRESDDAGLTDGGTENRAVISISEDGTIEQVNKATTNIFGWLRSELITRNIKLLVPSPYKERHDMFLDRYRSTGNAKVIGYPPRALFGLHRLGYGFPLMLSLQEKRKENGDRIFVGTLAVVPVSNDEGQIVISEDGTIIMISKSIENMFGYKANEVLGANITVYMLDAYAANHESYLRRYKETGEARVIGTAGRNLPGRRKDGSVIPVSLTVVEEYIGSDRFYSAVVRDTTDLVATIFIDGFGIIQNADSGISSLLGYRKEDIMGMNIKSIMPPPYNVCKN
jgi:PAS domain S-box-containing protein